VIADTLWIVRQQPWLGIATLMAAFVAMLVLLTRWTRGGSAHAEIPRKILHTGSGLLTLTFPLVFADVWPVLVLTSSTAMLLAAIKFLPSCRRFGRAVSDVHRTTFGELYFPVAVAVVFWLAHGESRLLFVVPVLVLTIADAACALVGIRYGANRYVGAAKSFEGSVAFVVAAFFCIHVPLLLWSGVGRAESLLMAATLALVLMLVEGSAPRGLDNLFVPIGSYFILRAYLELGAGDLLLRLAIAIGLIVLFVLARRRTAVHDDKLLAGAFVCYVEGALLGWIWLAAAVVPFAVHAWLWPRTRQPWLAPANRTRTL
jgi:phytol kinase